MSYGFQSDFAHGMRGRASTPVERRLGHPSKILAAVAQMANAPTGTLTRDEVLRANIGSYIQLSLSPLPLKARDKIPRVGKKWQERRFHPRDFRADDNVGILLGEASDNLVDVDLDSAGSRALAPIIFPELPSFGRRGEPTHLMARCKDAPHKTERFELTGKSKAVAERLELRPGTENKAVLLELRANGQTMVPPSVHPTGETLKWSGDQIPLVFPEVAWADLHRRAQQLAALALFCQAYPRGPGSRHIICLALAATLVSTGYSDADADRLVVAVANAAGDEEAEARGHNAAEARSKMRDKKPCTALPRLCDLLGIKEAEPLIRRWLGVEAAENVVSVEPLPDAIDVSGGNLAGAINAAHQIILRSGELVFRRGSEIVRIARWQTAAREEHPRARLLAADHRWLQNAMARHSLWQRRNQAGKYFATDPTAEHARMLSSVALDLGLPELRALHPSPTLTLEGRIIEAAGYDDETGLYLDVAPGVFPAVAQDPSREEAAQAIVRLRHLLRGFPFATERDLAVALAALLTAVVRPNLPTAPLFAFDAPTAGTGKTKLAELISIIVTNEKPPAMAQGKTPEEDEKRIATALRSGQTIILIDNCERPVEGDLLCSILTQESVSIRILGHSEQEKLPTCVTILATGNNLIVAGDMTRRTLLCRLDANMERPDERKFDADCHEEAAAGRPGFVVDLLTILTAYLAAGRPMPLKPLGSFEKWSIIREALVWLGLPDPLEARSALNSQDPRRAETAELLRLWAAALGSRRYTLAEFAREVDGTEATSPERLLFQYLIEMSGKNFWSARSVGRRLGAIRDQPINGMRLRSYGGREGLSYQLEISPKESERGPVIESLAGSAGLFSTPAR